MCLVCMFSGNALAVLSPDFTLAVVGRVITGFGTGMCFVTTMKMIALYTQEDRIGTYQAFFGGIYSLGNILAYLVIPRIIGFGWQWSYILPGVFCLVLLALLPLLRLTPASEASSAPLPLREIISLPAAWVLGLYHALSWGSMLTLANWIPSLLGEIWIGAAATKLAWGGALVMLISGLGRLCGGFVILRFSPLLIANGSIFILSILFLCLFSAPISGVILPLAVLAAWFASINFGAFFHLAARSTSSESLGTFIGFMMLLANGGAVFFTLMFGWMKENVGSFSWGFFVLAALGFLAFLFGRKVLKMQPA